MERTRKTWGEKYTLFSNDTCEVSLLYLNPFQRCSWHTHTAKWNQFFVIHGVVYIATEWGTSEVREGQIFTVRPGELHEFQTHEEGAVLQEIMYVRYEPEDINRRVLGGRLGESDERER